MLPVHSRPTQPHSRRFGAVVGVVGICATAVLLLVTQTQMGRPTRRLQASDARASLDPAPADQWACDTTSNFISGLRYSQEALTAACRDDITGCDADPKYSADGRTDVGEAVEYCKRQCSNRGYGCAGFFFQRHRNGHEICGFFDGDAHSDMHSLPRQWHGHQTGSQICELVSRAEHAAASANRKPETAPTRNANSVTAEGGAEGGDMMPRMPANVDPTDEPPASATDAAEPMCTDGTGRTVSQAYDACMDRDDSTTAAEWEFDDNTCECQDTAEGGDTMDPSMRPPMPAGGEGSDMATTTAAMAVGDGAYAGEPAKQLGFCVSAEGHDVDHDVERKPGSSTSDDECLRWCQAQPGQTFGCERIVNQDNHGCYLHRAPEVHHGNTAHNHVCWIFSHARSSATRLDALAARAAARPAPTGFELQQTQPFEAHVKTLEQATAREGWTPAALRAAERKEQQAAKARRVERKAATALLRAVRGAGGVARLFEVADGDSDGELTVEEFVDFASAYVPGRRHDSAQ